MLKRNLKILKRKILTRGPKCNRWIAISSILSFLLINASCSQVKNKESADKAFDKDDFQSGINLYSDIIKAGLPDNEKYICYYNRAYCYYKLNNYDNAISDLKVSLKVKKNDSKFLFIKGNAYWLYGRIYSKQGNKKESLQCLKEAAKYMDSNSLLLTTIGLEEIESNHLQDALEHLNRSIQLDSNNAYAYSNRALLFSKLSQLEKARNDITKSIKLDPKNPYAFKHSAMIYIQLNDYIHACEDLYKAKELGYSTFGNESDSKDVEILIDKYCNKH